MTEEQVFLAALDLPTPAERAAFLDTACGTDVGLRRQVEGLLAAHFKPGVFLDEPATLRAGRREEPVPDEKAPDDLHFLQASTRPDSLGRIGHYEVLRVIGRGGVGIVFQAFDEVLRREVALKVLSPQMAATSPARKRFLREARSSARVRHENVVQVFAVEEQPLPYLVMELIPGETLQQRLGRTGPLDATEVVRVGHQIAEGLAAAHAAGLVHRDIKPANVLIEDGPKGRVKLTDFGLARAADDASLTQSGVVAGTPLYMAPEQARGEALDARADLFSLGSVLYEMASGRPPFRAATAYGVMKRVIDDTPRPIRDLIPETPRWLADVIARLHAKKPEARFQTAREVADLLGGCEARPDANDTHTHLHPIPRSAPPGRRWRWIAVAALLLPALAAVLLWAAGLTPWPTRQQTPPDGKPPERKGPEEDFTNTLGMRFKRLPAGKFLMGSSAEEVGHWLKRVDQEGHKLFLKAEAPQHEVEITRPFYLGVTEVTVEQLRRFIEAEPKHGVDERWRSPGFDQSDEHPAVFVSWQNAVDFCAWLSKKEGKQYRLPTEAEWEYACRAGGQGTRYCFGDDDALLGEHAWFAGNARGATKPVGRKKPNAWGLHDMHGNVFEWCSDWHDLNYYLGSPTKDPQGPQKGFDRVKRGGAYCWGPVDARSAYRSAGGGGCESGFRVLLVVPEGGE